MNSIFWKLLGVAAVASVFYLGHGLHERHGVTLSDLESSASAADKLPLNAEWEYAGMGWPKSSNRRAVPGGWIVVLVSEDPIEKQRFGMTFVPDPDHKWK